MRDVIAKAAEITAGYPAEMIADEARQIAIDHKISAADWAWLAAAYEQAKPRVVRRVLSEDINVREAMG